MTDVVRGLCCARSRSVRWVAILSLVLGTLAWVREVTSDRSAAPEGTYDWTAARELYPGILHTRVTATDPRPMNVNCLRVDTTTSGLTFYTTPRCASWSENVAETQRKTTRQFMREAWTQGRPVVVAINADHWTPWIPATWDQETVTNVGGLAVCDGVLVSPGSGTPSLIVHKDGTVEMATTDAATDISSIQTAVSGFAFVLRDGEVLPGGEDLHPRTGIGLSRDGRYVYLMTIDGRQRASQGATCPELGRWLLHFGAYNGINMDGGGSTTMAWWDPEKPGPDKSTLLNVPVGNGRNPGDGERCNGNNLGVYFR